MLQPGAFLLEADPCTEPSLLWPGLAIVFPSSVLLFWATFLWLLSVETWGLGPFPNPALAFSAHPVAGSAWVGEKQLPERCWVPHGLTAWRTLGHSQWPAGCSDLGAVGPACELLGSATVEVSMPQRKQGVDIIRGSRCEVSGRFWELSRCTSVKQSTHESLLCLLKELVVQQAGK